MPMFLSKSDFENLESFTSAAFADHMQKVKEAQARSSTHLGSSLWRRVVVRLVNNGWFENTMGLIILLNSIVMVVEIDRSVHEENEELNTFHWTDICSWVALLIFIFDLFVRMSALRRAFWEDAGNVFDFAIVVSDCGCTLVDIIGGSRFPVSTLRVFRLAKLAKVSRVLRVFPELRLLIAGLMSSLSAIFWGTLLLFFFLLVYSMVAVLFVHPLNADVDYGDRCERCPRAYSSVMQAMLTLWQQMVTGDSWGEASIPLIEHRPQTLLFFIPAFLSIGMAVMNLILGVVVSAAQTTKERLEKDECADEALAKLEKQTHLYEMCVEMDMDRSGELSHTEILDGFQSEGDFRDIMMSLSITVEDFNVAWTIMDADDSGSVSYKELVCSLLKMKSSDVHFMLAYIKYYITMIKISLLEKFQSVDQTTQQLLQEEKEVLQEEKEVLQDETVLENLEVASPASFANGQESAPRGVAIKEAIQAEQSYQNSLWPADVDAAAALLPDKASPILHDEVQAWVNKVCNEVNTLKVDLIGELEVISRKFCAEGSVSSRIQQREPDLAVTSNNHKANGCESLTFKAKSSQEQALPEVELQGDISSVMTTV